MILLDVETMVFMFFTIMAFPIDFLVAGILLYILHRNNENRLISKLSQLVNKIERTITISLEEIVSWVEIWIYQSKR